MTSRLVRWISVGGQWIRASVMSESLNGDELEPVRKRANDESTAPRTIILMIPGNPGNEAFYTHFGRCVLERLGESDALFYTISSVNHVSLPGDLSGGQDVSDTFHLNEQVESKAQFVRDFVPDRSRLFLAGHSIGAYMMLRSLGPLLSENRWDIRSALALFPTIEKMAVSPNGRRLGGLLNFLDNYDWLAKFLTCWLSLLPRGVKRFLVSLNLKPICGARSTESDSLTKEDSETPSRRSVPDEVVEAATELLDMNVFRNIIRMSADELRLVDELDERLLAHADLLKFYYGRTDGWAPIHLGEAMLDRLGADKVELDDRNCEHAFVIRDGEIIADWLATKIKTAL